MQKPTDHLIITSPVFELLASMYRLQSHEQIESAVDNEFPAAKKIDSHKLDQWVSRTRSMLPDFIKNELEVFFHFESFFALTMVRFSWEHQCYQSIEAFLSTLEKTPAQDICALFCQTGFTPKDTANPDDWQQVIAYIKKSNLPEVEKWKLAYLFTDVEETKNRLIRLITFCAGHYFKNDMETWQAEQQKSINIVRKHLSGDIGELFPYLAKAGVIASDTQLVLAPSYFYHRASLTSDSPTNGSFICLFGVQQISFLQETPIGEDRILEAFKILSDEKRIRLIKLLNAGPLYGYELAQKLDLSNSTVSHHLSVLSSINIVHPTRVENKVYYKVNKEELEKLMKSLTKALLE